MSKSPSVLVFLLFIAASSGSFLDQVSRASAAFSYDPEDQYAPSRWGDLPDSAICRSGDSQSPIALHTITSERALHQKGNRPRPSLKKSRMGLHDKTHNWALTCDGKVGSCGGTKFHKHKFHLHSMHFHSPSEHTVNGEHPKLEMHMVHLDDDGNVAVVGTLFRIGKPNKVFEKILDAKEAGEKEVGVKLPALIKRYNSYYQYMGSFTTPPCTQNVTWIVSKKTLHVSEEQIDRYLATAHSHEFGNNRPEQALHARKVYRYGPF